MKKISLVIFLFCLFLTEISVAQVAPCVGSAFITATPPPDTTTGCYGGGVTVTFCISITDYAQSGIDWLCGVVPTFGPGWDLTTLAPVSASPSCDLQGVWGWFPSCTSLPPGSGMTWGPGFYYDSPANSPTGTVDGIPGNNYGDNCINFNWNFCFQVTTLSNLPAFTASSLVIDIYSDYMAGNWGTNSCQDQVVFGALCINPNCTVTLPTLTTVSPACFGDTTGTAFAQGAGGYPPYTYLWSTGQTTQSISGLAAGIYSVTVTDSIGCSKNVFYNITGPADMLDNATITAIGCDSTGTGSIVTNVSGGTAPYSYLWSTTATTSSISNLAAGIYTLTVTDSVSCVKTFTYTIIAATPVTFTTSSTTATCGQNNGTATVSVTSGIPPYTYNWTPPVSTSNFATNLSVGTYYITVVDSNGCSKSDSIVVNATSTITLSTAVTAPTCNPPAGGTATAIPSGGTAPFTYLWSPSGGNGQTATNLAAGTYTVLVTDSNLCTATATIVIDPIIPITYTTSSTNALCNTNNTGTATIQVTGGGVSPFTYLWSDGSTNSSLNGVASGTYSFTITDLSGCTATGSVTVNQNPTVFVTVNPDTTVCSGQAVNLIANVSVGTPNFGYSWSNGQTTSSQQVNPTSTTTYNVTVTDGTNCTATTSVTVTTIDYPVISLTGDATICEGTPITLSASGGANYSWSNGSTASSQQVSPTSSTNYIVTVSNGNCSSVDSVLISVSPSPDAAFTADTTSLTVNFVNNSTGGIIYNWDFGDGSTSTDFEPVHTYGSVGTYTVILIVTNANGCKDTATLIIEYFSSLGFPNVFTPNGDGDNDLFHLEEYGLQSVVVEIYNRWGLKIFSWNKPNGEWDGKTSDGEVAPDGTYYVLIRATGLDGTNFNRTGTLTLISSKK